MTQEHNIKENTHMETLSISINNINEGEQERAKENALEYAEQKYGGGWGVTRNMKLIRGSMTFQMKRQL